MYDALHRRFLETGSKEELQLLMQRHYGPIRAHIAKIVKNYHDADEITNATFLKAFNERETIKHPEKLVGWLYTTAKNAAIDRRRQMSELTSLDSADGERTSADASMRTARQAQQTETDQSFIERYPATSLRKGT